MNYKKYKKIYNANQHNKLHLKYYHRSLLVSLIAVRLNRYLSDVNTVLVNSKKFHVYILVVIVYQKNY